MERTEAEIVAMQKSHATGGVDFSIYPVEGETYPENFTFTPREMVGRRFKTLKGQEVVCAYVETIPDREPHAVFAPDFTKNYDRYHGLSGANWTVNSAQWLNMEKNLPDMQCTLDLLPKAKVVYCVGSGPALMKNWKELEKVKGRPGHYIIGCNELVKYLPEGLLDYYTALDAGSPDHWWHGRDVSGVTAVFGPPVPPSFKQAGWKRILWYKIGLSSDFNKHVSSRRGHLKTVVPLYGVGPSELQIAWFMRPETVVLVGHSYAYDMVDRVIYEHINEPLTEDRWEGVLRSINSFATTNIRGEPVVTDYHIMITAMMTLASCQMLMDAGVQVINATEGGILRSNPELPAYRDKPIFPECRVLREFVGSTG